MRNKMKFVGTVKELLDKWARQWALQRIGTEFYRETISIPKLPKKRRGYLVHFSDAECLVIEQAVMMLKQNSLLNFQVVMALYCQGFSEKQICEALGIKPNKLNTARVGGVAYLEGLLFGLGFIFLGKDNVPYRNLPIHRSLDLHRSR